MPRPLVQSRRAFLGRTAATLSAATFTGPLTAVSSAQASLRWDLSWLDNMHGVHKQVFDLSYLDTESEHPPLLGVSNYLRACREVFGLPASRVSTVVGIASSGFPLVVQDALWERYRLGEEWKIKDPVTNAWAVRNVYAELPAGDALRRATVRALQAEGTVLWMCNNALNYVSRQLATKTQQSQAIVRDELIAGFLPGIRLVPAHVLLVGLAQEKGFTYIVI